ncbi:hypothetical protein SAMN05444339_1168 [Loktanella atrilutea]|uniref:Uncharacterized protein n=1 Tax=Loktanella atrilutea TaxID=366533 RepID=A0A1M5F0J2_LOKAT|nr:hypothetical protein SAMN05444339_1168 [Loktanella atrilutea]
MNHDVQIRDLKCKTDIKLMSKRLAVSSYLSDDVHHVKEFHFYRKMTSSELLKIKKFVDNLNKPRSVSLCYADKFIYLF